jgi:hypothetical protein
LFSTLLSSLVHAIGATGAAMTYSLPARWRDWHLRAVRSGFDGRPRKLITHAGFMTLANVVSVSVWLIALTYIWLLTTVYTSGGQYWPI